MKQTGITLAVAGSLLMSLHAPTALGQLRVERVDADTLRVSEFQGSPPHRRQYVSREAYPELYQRYESYLQAESEPQPTAALHGAPGKHHVRSRTSLERAAEAAATPREANNGRLWFGAPGKGRHSGL